MLFRLAAASPGRIVRGKRRPHSPPRKGEEIVRTTRITIPAILGVCAFLVSAAHADCGKPNSRQAVSVLSSARALTPNSELEEVRAPQMEEDSDRPSIAGLWLTTSTIEGQQLQSFESFTNEGLEFLNDSGSPIEGNVCFGIYQTGPRGVITVNHPSWNYDGGGNLIGTVVIKEQITVDAGGKTFHGNITVDIYDLSGARQAHLAGTYTGKRITV